jgi:hypothetical protein
MDPNSASGPKKRPSKLSQANTLERRKAREENQDLEQPLPIRYKSFQINRTAAVNSGLATQDPQVNPNEPVEVYQLYTRLGDCSVSQHRLYTYHDNDRKGSLVSVRPKPTSIFHIDKAVISREPEELLGKKVKAKDPPQDMDELSWERIFLIRECMVDIYRTACNYFVHQPISPSGIDETGYREASDLCRRIFGEELTKEQVNPNSPKYLCDASQQNITK